MAKKIILISSFPLCVVLAILAIVFVGIGRSQPAADVSSEPTDVNQAVDTLISDYNKNASPASTLVYTAGDYAWNRKYDKAERLYRAVNDKQPNDNWGVKARLGLARLAVLNLIEQKEYEDANQRIDTMIADFNDEPDTAIALFHIGQELFWQRQFGEARDAFEKGVEMFPGSPAANEMRLWSAKTGCCVLIYGRRATDAEVVAAIDKMITDFNDDPGLAGAIYWISKEYEWTKGTSLSRAGWYDAPNSAYQQIMQKFSDTPFGQAAEWDQKRLNHRMKIFNLIKEADPFDPAQGGQNAIDIAIEEMVADLEGRPEIAGELYWIACGYEERPDKEARSKEIYQRIVKEYPDTAEASRAALDVRRRIITDLINAGDINGSEVLMDKFMTDFSATADKNEHPYAGSCLGRVAIGYYKKGYELREAGKIDESKQFVERAANVFQRILESGLTLGTDAVYVYFYGAISYHELGRWEGAIENYQKVLDDWPNFEHVCGIQAAIAGCYESLRDKEGVPKEAVNPLIEEAYKTVLANYPNCYSTKDVAYRLAEMSEEKGDKVAAGDYYRIFLEKTKARCGDSRIPAIKVKLQELERFDNGLTVEGGTSK